MPTIKLTKRSVENHEPGNKDTVLRDTEVKGFTCKVTPKGRRVYMLYYRTQAGQERRPVIGVHGDVTCEQARKIAQEWKSGIALGQDPSRTRNQLRKAPTMEELCARYLEDYAEGRKKPSSVRSDRHMIKRFIVPYFGNHKVEEIDTQQVTKLHNSLKKTPYQANRVRALLSKMFELAEAWKIRPQYSNPTRHVGKFPEQKRQRFLSGEELKRLAGFLEQMEHDGELSPKVSAAIRLLVLTGFRTSELLGLRWETIDFERGIAYLGDTKTGQQYRMLGKSTVEFLSSLPWREDEGYVIPGEVEGQQFVNLRKPWRKVRAAAGLPDVRLHDLRHTHASAGAGMGLSLPLIGKLLGHTQASTTMRYAHLADDPLMQAADVVAGYLSDAMSGRAKAG